MNLTRQKIWQGVLGELEVGMSKANFKTWVKNTQLVSIEGTTATVSVPHIFARDRLATVYNDQIIEALRKLVPDIIAVEYVVGSSASDDVEDIAAPQQIPSTPSEKPKPKPQAATQTSESPQLSLQSSSIGQRYSFENFVVGSGNRLAFSAAKLVSEKPGVCL
jgi:chromosomal replication initiator protein